MTGKIPKLWALEKQNEPRCNLCLGANNRLTGDHVPPRACGNKNRVKIDLYLAESHREKPVTRTGYRGVEFKTLCAECNNVRVGSHDGAFGEFVALLRAAAESSTRNAYEISFRPSAVIRSILGHVVAAQTVTSSADPEVAIRDFLVNGSPLEQRFKIHYWLYNQSRIVVVPDFVLSDFVMHKVSGILSVTKFDPVVICVEFDGDFPFGVPTLHQHASRASSEIVTDTVDLTPTLHPDFPERGPFFDARYAVVMSELSSLGIETQPPGRI